MIGDPLFNGDGSLTIPAIHAKKASTLDGGNIASDGAGNLTVSSVIPANGISATIVTAPLTPETGAEGSMTFVNGILTAQTPAT